MQKRGRNDECLEPFQQLHQAPEWDKLQTNSRKLFVRAKEGLLFKTHIPTYCLWKHNLRSPGAEIVRAGVAGAIVDGAAVVGPAVVGITVFVPGKINAELKGKVPRIKKQCFTREGRRSPERAKGYETGIKQSSPAVVVAAVKGATVDGAGVVGSGVVGAGVVGAGMVGAGVVGAGVAGAGVAEAGVNNSAVRVRVEHRCSSRS